MELKATKISSDAKNTNQLLESINCLCKPLSEAGDDLPRIFFVLVLLRNESMRRPL